MKRVLIICLLVAGTSMVAQPAREHGPRHEKKDFMHELSAQQRAELKTKRMTLSLNLTEAQQLEVQRLNVEVENSRSQKMNSKKLEGEITATEHFNRISSNLDAKIAHKRKLQSILTKEQFATFEKNHIHKGPHRKGHSKRKKR